MVKYKAAAPPSRWRFRLAGLVAAVGAFLWLPIWFGWEIAWARATVDRRQLENTVRLWDDDQVAVPAGPVLLRSAHVRLLSRDLFDASFGVSFPEAVLVRRHVQFCQWTVVTDSAASGTKEVASLYGYLRTLWAGLRPLLRPPAWARSAWKTLAWLRAGTLVMADEAQQQLRLDEGVRYHASWHDTLQPSLPGHYNPVEDPFPATTWLPPQGAKAGHHRIIPSLLANASAEWLTHAAVDTKLHGNGFRKSDAAAAGFRYNQTSAWFILAPSTPDAPDSDRACTVGDVRVRFLALLASPDITVLGHATAMHELVPITTASGLQLARVVAGRAPSLDAVLGPLVQAHPAGARLWWGRLLAWLLLLFTCAALADEHRHLTAAPSAPTTDRVDTLFAASCLPLPVLAVLAWLAWGPMPDFHFGRSLVLADAWLQLLYTLAVPAAAVVYRRWAPSSWVWARPPFDPHAVPVVTRRARAPSESASLLPLPNLPSLPSLLTGNTQELPRPTPPRKRSVI